VGAWTIDDALRMQAARAPWLSTVDGAKCASAVDEFLHAAFPDLDPPSWDTAS